MARTITVKSARKSPGSCLSPTCKHESRVIAAGESYKHFSMKLQRGGIKKSYHIDCAIPASHRTTSRMGEIWDAQEEAEREIPSIEDDCSALESIAQDFAQTVREVSEGYQESAENIESGFGHSTYVSEELAEKAQALESWADELESPDFDEFDSSEEQDIEREVREVLQTGMSFNPDDEDYESEEDFEERVAEEVARRLEEAQQSWWDEQVSKLQDALGNCPV